MKLFACLIFAVAAFCQSANQYVTTQGGVSLAISDLAQPITGASIIACTTDIKTERFRLTINYRSQTSVMLEAAPVPYLFPKCFAFFIDQSKSSIKSIGVEEIQAIGWNLIELPTM